LLNYFVEAIEDAQGYVIPPARPQQQEGKTCLLHNTTNKIYLISNEAMSMRRYICSWVPLRRLEYRGSTPVLDVNLYFYFYSWHKSDV